MTRRPAAWLASAAALTAAVVAAIPTPAAAHWTTVACQSPGTWQLTNSEAAYGMTFTTDQGHAGSIPAGGSTTVSWSGTSLTVHSEWADGFQRTDVGEGDCTVADTTTTTTVAAETTTTEAPPSTTTTLPVETTTTATPEPTTTTVPTTSTTPGSTAPASSGTAPASSGPTATASPAAAQPFTLPATR